MLTRRSFVTLSASALAVAPALGATGAPDPTLDALFARDTFARIPAGDFSMGSKDGLEDEVPVHQVRITRPFEIGKWEVTQAQWEAVLTDPHAPKTVPAAIGPEQDPISAHPSHFKGASLPVESVSWNDIQVFLQKLNVRDSRYEFRLPTEAEWECAAKGGGEAKMNLDAVAWYKDNAGGATKPVGQKEPNHWGIYDQDGNVAEWVQDWYGPDYYEASPHVDPKGPATGSYRVFRGGSWISEVKFTRPSMRNFDFPGSRFYHVGFRLVRTEK